MKKFCIVLTALAFGIGSAHAMKGNTTLLPQSDDFESYATNANLTAAYDSNTITGLSTLQNHTAAGTKSVYNPNTDLAGTGLTGSWKGVTASTATPVIIDHWFYDAFGGGGTASLNGRTGVAIGSYDGGVWGSGTLNNYIYLGPYHATSTTHYVSRVVFGTGSGYVATSGVGFPVRSLGWHRLTIQLGTATANNNARFSVDGVADATERSFTAPRATLGWNCFKFGSLAGTSYNNAFVDDLSITGGVQVPVTMSGLWID